MGGSAQPWDLTDHKLMADTSKLALKVLKRHLQELEEPKQIALIRSGNGTNWKMTCLDPELKGDLICFIQEPFKKQTTRIIPFADAVNKLLKAQIPLRKMTFTEKREQERRQNEIAVRLAEYDRQSLSHKLLAELEEAFGDYLSCQKALGKEADNFLEARGTVIVLTYEPAKFCQQVIYQRTGSGDNMMILLEKIEQWAWHETKGDQVKFNCMNAYLQAKLKENIEVQRRDKWFMALQDLSIWQIKTVTQAPIYIQQIVELSPMERHAALESEVNFQKWRQILTCI